MISTHLFLGLAWLLLWLWLAQVKVKTRQANKLHVIKSATTTTTVTSFGFCVCGKNQPNFPREEGHWEPGGLAMFREVSRFEISNSVESRRNCIAMMTIPIQQEVGISRINKYNRNDQLDLCHFNLLDTSVSQSKIKSLFRNRNSSFRYGFS